MNITEAANVVQSEIVDQNGIKQFDPIVTAILVQVITRLVVKYGPILLDKIINQKGLNICNKLMIKTVIRQCCTTKEDWKTHGAAIYEAVLRSATKFTYSEIHSLIVSVNSI